MDVKSISDYRKRPHTSQMDFSGVSVKDIVKSYITWRDGLEVKEAVPEDLAIQFYLTNSGSAALEQLVDKQQPLTLVQQLALDLYYKSMDEIGLRCFFYCLLICTRETRHVSENSAMLEKTESLGAMKFWKSIKGTGSSGAVEKLLNNPPDCSLINYTEHMVHTFQLGGHSGGYAGPKWAAVARPLRDFVHGTTTMEMFCDTVWTLAHNNGPIFNKGMLFKHYDGSQLIKILDVQRAGMIPNMVEHNESSFVGKQHKSLLAVMRKAIPDIGVEAINWQKVVDLGAVGHYGVKKSKDGLPPGGLPKNEFGETLPKSILDIDKANKLKDPTMLQITPTEFVKKISRKETK